MGYTHYWENEKFTPEQWADLQRAARKIFIRVRAKGIGIAGWDGKGEPTITDVAPHVNAEIRFNGRDPDEFETCAILRDRDDTFCKTGRRPYDLAVVALLECASRIGPLTWTSDGDEEETAEGRQLADQVMKSLRLKAVA